jgi:hypothetical protein
MSSEESSVERDEDGERIKKPRGRKGGKKKVYSPYYQILFVLLPFGTYFTLLYFTLLYFSLSVPHLLVS